MEPRGGTLTVDASEGAGALLRGAQQRDPCPGRSGDQADGCGAVLGRDLQLRGCSGAVTRLRSAGRGHRQERRSRA